MSVGRNYFGLGLIHNFIFVVAGVDSRGKIEKSCERYDILADTWRVLPESTHFDEFGFCISLIVSSKRYLTVLGGLN